jgi:hypothetical protein
MNIRHEAKETVMKYAMYDDLKKLEKRVATLEESKKSIEKKPVEKKFTGKKK